MIQDRDLAILLTSAAMMTAVVPAATVLFLLSVALSGSLYVTQASFPLVLRAPPPPPAPIPAGLSATRRKGGRVQIKRAFLLRSTVISTLVRVVVGGICPCLFGIRLKV